MTHLILLPTLLFSMINIPPTYPTPLYVFSQVVSLPACTETVLDQNFIENAEKMIKELEEEEYGDEEMIGISSHLLLLSLTAKMTPPW